MNLAGILGIVGVVVLVIIIIILSVALGRKSKDLKMKKQVKADIVAEQRPKQFVRADFDPQTQLVPPPLLPRPQPLPTQAQPVRKPTAPEYRLRSNPAINDTPYSAIPAPNGNAGYGFLPARRNGVDSNNPYTTWSNFGMQ